MCRELLSALASEQLKCFTNTGDTALHLAARRRDLDLVKILVDYGAAVDSQNVSIVLAQHNTRLGIRVNSTCINRVKVKLPYI